MDKTYFQQDMAYGDFKELPRRTASDKLLRDKAFNIAKNLKYDEYQRGPAPTIYNFFIKESTATYRGTRIITNINVDLLQ